ASNPDFAWSSVYPVVYVFSAMPPFSQTRSRSGLLALGFSPGSQADAGRGIEGLQPRPTDHQSPDLKSLLRRLCTQKYGRGYPPSRTITAQLRSLILVRCSLVSPPQRRPVVRRVRRIVRCVRIVVASAHAPQRWLGVVPLVVQAALVLDPRQPRLHLVELRARHHVLRLRRQDRRNLILHRCNAVRRRRMVAERLRQRARLVLLERRQLLKDAHHALRIVPRLVHVLNAKEVRLRLVLARELQEGQRDRKLRCLIDAVARPRPLRENNQRNLTELHIVQLGHLARGMVRRHVR